MTMTLKDIYDQYMRGSRGFVLAVETHCGFSATRNEIKRIAEAATTAEEFESIWENCNWWTDENAACRW